MPETAFLVEAVERQPAPDFAPVNLRSRALKVLEMYERLERLDRAHPMVR